MSVQDKVIFRRLNSDDDLRHLQPGESPYFLNCRSSVTQKNAGGGSTENVQGNLKLLNPLLPAGTNKCIGAGDDIENNRIVYFIWNSNNNHAIFQYTPTTGAIDKILINSILNFDKDHYINHIDFVNDLCYWTDGFNPPRKINLLKANTTNKFLKNNIYFLNKQIIHGFDKSLYYTVTVSSPGSPISGITILNNPNADAIEATSGREGEAANSASLQDVAKLFQELWNNSDLFTEYEATTCNGFISITDKTINVNNKIVVKVTTTEGTFELKVIADNYYPNGINFKEDFINRVKYPFECQPDISVEQDTLRLTNLIQNKVFQFRTQIIYDDNEPSALSPISAIASIPSFCGQDSTQSSYNVIKIDWSVPRIEDINVLSIVKYVNLYVRQGNLGKFGFIISLTKEQFLAAENTFKFYNDGIYPAIDDAFSNKLFDAVPLLSQSQVLAQNRIFDGGITEGYDPTCINSKLSISYEDNVQPATFSIRGRNFIRNFYGEGNFATFQPIVSQDDGNSDFGFGGVGPLSTNIVYNDIIFADYKSYKQTFPTDSNGKSLEGFVFYLAGTNFKSVSAQGDSVTTFSYYPLPTGSDNKAKGHRRVTSEAVNDGNNPIFQNYSINNVPPGKYILRIASHLITNDDLNANNLDWQRTSTNCLEVGGVIGNECLLEILADGTIQTFDHNGNLLASYPANSTIGDSCVADLSNISVLNFPVDINGAFSIAGYLCDSDTANTGIDVLKDTRIELASVQFNHARSSQYNSLPAFYGLTFFGSGGVRTDHNGYFFFTTIKTSISIGGKLDLSDPAMKINDIQVANGTIGKQDWDGFGGVSAWTGRDTVGIQLGIFQNTLGTVKANARTVINGIVTSDGTGITGISIISTRGRVVKTDIKGNYELIVYGDSQPGGSRSDNIIYVLGDGCLGTFTPPIDYYNIAINGIGPFSPITPSPSPHSGIYNKANPVTTMGANIIIFNSGAIASLKKGGKYRFGIVYYDYANRSTTTLTDDSLNLSIPFPTNPASTGFRKGRVLVDWDIYSLPPDWATHYQWVRTLNGNQQKLLQWAAKTVTYIDDSGATVSSINATQIKISLANITDYTSIHPDSNVGYTFEDGDRLILIKNPSGNFYNDYYDFKIKGVKSGALLDIFIDNNHTVVPDLSDGVFFEIYNPTKTATDEIFYEIGECYPIVENKNGIKIHDGSTINQEYWEFYDNFFDPTTSKLGFVSLTPNDFKVGDTIVITQNPGFDPATILYNTTAKIIALTTTVNFGQPVFVIVTDQAFLVNTLPQSGNVIRAANGTFKNGDTWNRLREIPISSATSIVGWYVEDYSISDFYISKDQSIGRPNAVNREIGQINRQSTIRFSNNYIQDTKINGLSSNEGLNEKVLPANYGTIKKLVYTKTTLLAIHENSQIVSMEIGKQTLRDTGNTQLVAITDQVLPTDYQYQGSLGTQNPESIVKDDDDNVHGIDVNKGIAWTRQVNGLVPISEFKMITYFREKCNRLKASGQTIRVPAVYDRGFNQVIFSFNSAGEEPAETIAFTKKDRYWESFYPFVGEYYCRGRNNEVVAFLNGELWKQNANPLYNNFFGVQYSQKIRAIGNISGSTMKVWLNTSLEGTNTDKWSAPIITTLEGQQSELVETDFELIENVWYADLLKDKTTSNIKNPLIFGDDLRSSALDITFENKSAEYSLLYAINIYAISSEKTDKA